MSPSQAGSALACWHAQSLFEQRQSMLGTALRMPQSRRGRGREGNRAGGKGRKGEAREAEKQAGREAGRQAEKQAGRPAGRQAEKQAGRQAGRRGASHVCNQVVTRPARLANGMCTALSPMGVGVAVNSAAGALVVRAF